MEPLYQNEHLLNFGTKKSPKPSINTQESNLLVKNTNC